MINQLEVPMFLEDALPEMRIELKSENSNTAYNCIATLSNFTQMRAKAHDYSTVKRCFAVADILYQKGNSTVKNAIENIFVYSFSNIFMADRTASAALRGLVPGTLYSLYIAQVCHPGC